MFLRYGSLLIASILLISSVHSARAQTCAAPIVLMPGATVTGSTCDGLHVADTFCGNLPNPGRNTVFRFVIGPPLSGHLTLTSGSTPFAPVMYLMDGAASCDSAPCLATGDTATPIAFDGLAPGGYWLVIAAPPNAPSDDCGTFALSNDATEIDSIFADGFDGN